MMSRRFLLTIVTLIAIVGVASIAIFLAKGYTFSPSQGTVSGTGIISVTSKPSGASVYVDGHLTTATDTTISSLPPKKYTLKIVKEGFISWEKEIEVKEGLVSEVGATLFPSLPTIYPLTFNGVISPIISPDGQHLAFGVPFIDEGTSRQKGGIWVWTMEQQPIAFNRSAQPHQLVASSGDLDFSKSAFKFSPDSKQLLITMQEGGSAGNQFARNYLLTVGSRTSIEDLRDITPTITSTINGWEEDQKLQEAKFVEAIKDLNLRKIASESANLKWSPDETKFISIMGEKVTPVPSVKPLGQSAKVSPPPTGGSTPLTKTKAKVYDLALLGSYKEYELPEALSYQWLPESEHIVLVQEDRVEVVEFDGKNVSVVYAGNFDPNSVFVWPDSSRFVIMSSYPSPTASVPNLFGVNLK